MQEKMHILAIIALTAALFTATLVINMKVQSASAQRVCSSKSGACAGTTISSTGLPGALQTRLGHNFGNSAVAGSLLCAGKPRAHIGPLNSNTVCAS
jgi:hypothetical protein